jgi:alanine racemase
VDLGAIRTNVAQLRRRCGRARLLAVVKADAYGHGMLAVGRAVLEAGADALGVFTVGEAAGLRAGGIDAPVLVLGRVDPAEADALVGTRAAAAVFDADSARAIDAAGRRHGRRVRAHVKVDTGMSRLGVAVGDAPSFVEFVRGLRGLEVEGIFTHLAGSEAADRTSAYDQFERFIDLLDGLEASGPAGCRPPVAHIANSAALIDSPEMALEMVRPGIALYGIRPSPHVSRIPPLEPALAWKARVIAVRRVAPGTAVGYGGRWTADRPTTIATLGVGYADGYRRALSPGGAVLLGGRRCPVAGTISMEMTGIDAGDADVRVGDAAVLIGRDGDETVTADEVAAAAGTIAYEVLAGIAARVPRFYAPL